MKIRQTIMVLTGALLFGVAPLAADEEKNLIENPGFENISCNSLGCEIKEWNSQLGSATANTTDKHGGEQSVEIAISTSGVDGYMNQQVSLSDNDFPVGATFELTIHYRVKKIASGGNLHLDCFWEAAAGGDSEEAAAHEKDILTQVVETAVNSEWQKFTIKTTKPKKTKGLSVGIKFTKGSTVLFDDFSLIEKVSETPFISVTPETLPALSINVGEEKAFQTLKIRQGHLTSETTFAITGANPDQFSLSATSMPADKSEMELVVTYKPKAVGNHKAALIFDNINHTTILPNSISLQGACSDPSAKPQITVSPTSITDFQAIVGEEQQKSISVSSINCTDYVYLKVEHIKGAAFTSRSSMLAKNFATTVDIMFKPTAEGEYESKVTFSTEGGESVSVSLKGKGDKRSAENIDWLTDFKWDLSSPLAMLNETFDNVNHNKTIVLDGWQNVAQLDKRPWWGYDGKLVPQQDSDSKCAKATTYQYATAPTGIWDMWLITPALDYKNAGSKIFSFSVMGQYLPEEIPEGGSDAVLEIYYIDANMNAQKDTVFFQDLTESFDIPVTADENLTWRSFQLDLAPYAETVADIFHMGFHFKGPNGNEGAVTYYIDNVCWGRTDIPILSVTPAYIIDSASVVGKERWIGEFTVSGKNLVDDIELSLAGSNYNRFKLSKTKLGKEGGKVQVAFTGVEAGIHEAYVQIDSKDAASKFVVLAVRCYAADDPDKPDVPDPVTPEEGLEEVRSENVGTVRSEKRLRDGQVIIVRDGKEYNVLGVRLF